MSNEFEAMLLIIACLEYIILYEVFGIHILLFIIIMMIIHLTHLIYCQQMHDYVIHIVN